MTADGDLLYVDSFLPWFWKDDKSLHDDILIRMSFCVQMYFSWVSPSLEVLVSVSNCFWNPCNLFLQ